MTVDFYILDTPDKRQAMLFACKLVENAHVENQTVFIHTASASESEEIDQLLWTYRADSFIPHEQDNSDASAPILISHNAPTGKTAKTLLNLNSALPDFYMQFDHIIEVVYTNADVQQQARERYKQYRDAKLTLNTFKLKANDL